MAAPLKYGIDYFPYDIDMDNDDKLSMIIAEFGVKGELLWIKMLSYTYKNEGYYFDFKEDVLLKFLRRYNYCGFNMSFVKEVVPRFIKWGLFDQSVYDAFQILTSIRIQKTWLDATRKRIGCKIDSKFSLLEVSSGITAEETPKKTEVTDKEKEKKEKEIKEDSIGATASPTDKQGLIPSPLPAVDETSKKKSRANFIAPTLKQVEEYMMKVKGDPGKQNSWPESKCLNLAGKCYDHYTANGWTQGKGKPIVDWEAACRNFIRNEVEGVFANSTQNFPNKDSNFPKQPKNLPESPTNFQTSRPVVKELTEEDKAKMEKSFLNDAFTDFLKGKFNVQMMGIGVYESLKLFKQVKLSNADFSRILEKAKEARLSYLKSSTDRNDIELLKNYNPDTESEKEKVNMIAKRYVVSELFELFKSQGKTELV